MSVKLRVGTFYVSRTQGSGDTIASIATRLSVPKDVLPVLFDARMAGDGGNKHLRAFLDTCAAAKFDARSHFAQTPEVHTCIEEVIRSGAKLDTKHLVAACEAKRASSRAPTLPTPPTVARPTQAEIDAAAALVAQLQQAETAATEQRNQSATLSQSLAQIAAWLVSKAAWDVQAAEAAKGDPLGARRDVLTRIGAINRAPLLSLVTLLQTEAPDAAAAVTAAIAAVDTAIGKANAECTAVPPPVTVGAQPTLPASALATYQALSANGPLTREALSELSLKLAPLAAAADTAVADATARRKAAQEAQSALTRAQGSWDQYATSMETYQSGKARAEADWLRWDHAAKTIQQAADEHAATTGDTFGALVASMADGLLQGRKLRIDPESGIFLGPEAVEYLSESTRWRTEVAVMAACARTCKSPLLVIDGADILDQSNRQAMFAWLTGNIVPYFEHVVLTATARGELTDETPIGVAGACKYLLNKGQLTKLG